MRRVNGIGLKELKEAVGEFHKWLNGKYPQTESGRINYLLTGRLSTLISCAADKIAVLEINEIPKIKFSYEIEIPKNAKLKYLKETTPCGDLDFLELRNKEAHEINPLKMGEKLKNGDSIKIEEISIESLPEKARLLFSERNLRIELGRVYTAEEAVAVKIKERKIFTNSILQHLNYKFVNMISRRE